MKRVFNLELPSGEIPFRRWLRGLDSQSRAIIRTYIDRVATGGGKKNVQALGDGVFEIKIKFGPGFRVYFGEDGQSIILLLVGGSKRTQKRDITTAKKYWRNYVSKQHLQ